MSQIQCINKCIHISVLEECIVQIKKKKKKSAGKKRRKKKQNNSYSTQLISLRNLLIKRKKKNRHLKAYVELDGPSSGSIKVCRVNTAMSYCPFIFQLNKTLIFITIIQESLFLLSKEVKRKDKKRKKREAFRLQLRSVSLKMNSKRTSDTHKTFLKYLHPSDCLSKLILECTMLMGQRL